MWLFVFATFAILTIGTCVVYALLNLPKTNTKPPALQTCGDFVNFVSGSGQEPKELCQTGTDCRGQFALTPDNKRKKRPYRSTPANPICSTEITGSVAGKLGHCMPLTSTVCVRAPHSDDTCPAEKHDDAITNAVCGAVTGNINSGSQEQSFKAKRLDCLSRIPTSEASAHLMWKCVPNKYRASSVTGGLCTNLRACHTDTQCGKGSVCLQKLGTTVFGKCMKVCNVNEDCPMSRKCVDLDNNFDKATTTCAGVKVCAAPSNLTQSRLT